MEEFSPHISSLLDGVVNSLGGLLPEGILTLAFLCSILASLFLSKYVKHITWWLNLIALLAVFATSCLQLQDQYGNSIFFGMVLPSYEATWMKLLVTFICLLFLFYLRCSQHFKQQLKKADDLLVIILGVHLGLNMMLMSVNWLMAFVSIEMVSIGSYIMVTYLAAGARQSEAGMKYMLFGALCSAIMLYGISFIYGFTGTLNFADKAHLLALGQMDPTVLVFAVTLLLTGIGFKLSIAPFHFWSPDVYEGAPAIMLSFLATAPKVGAIYLFLKFYHAWSTIGSGIPADLHIGIIMACAGTMILGNFAALWQKNLKRMMAYSSIAHTGFMLMIVISNPQQAFIPLFFYLVIYVITTFGVFNVAGFFEERHGITAIDEFRGLGKVYPVLMCCVVVMMVSLIGLPPTAGFAAKLFVFSGTIVSYQHDPTWGKMLLLISGAATTVVALFFYFNIPLNAFLRGDGVVKDPKRSNWVLWMAICAAVLLLLLGIFPSFVVDLLGTA